MTKYIWTLFTAVVIGCSVPAALAEKIGPEFRVAERWRFKQYQTKPVVARLPGVGFVVAWKRDGYYNYLHGRMFNETGEPLGPQFIIADGQGVDGRNVDVSPIAGGGFVVAWTYWDSDFFDDGIHAKIYDSQGNETWQGRLDQSGLHYPAPPSVAMTAEGFVVAWNNRVGLPFNAYVRRFMATGEAIGDESEVASDVEWDTQVSGLGDGGFVVSYTGRKQGIAGAYAQRFSASGEPAGHAIRVDPSREHVHARSATSLIGGGFAILWRTSEGAIMARLYDSQGQGGDEVFVSNSGPYHNVDHRVTSRHDGGIVVVFSRNDINNEGMPNVFVREFDAEGLLVDKFRANTVKKRPREFPSVASLGRRGFVVVWQLEVPWKNVFIIIGQRFD
jgi:hypothetical protein